MPVTNLILYWHPDKNAFKLLLVNCNCEYWSACDARDDHGCVANTRDSPAITV